MTGFDILVIIVSILSILIFGVWTYYYCTRILYKQNIEEKKSNEDVGIKSVDKTFEEIEIEMV